MDKDVFWGFEEGNFPSIEIDVEHFKSLSRWERAVYIFKLLFQEKDLGNRLNMLTWILNNLSKIGKVFIKNKEFSEYMNILENGTKLVGVSAALGNVVKAKQSFRNTKNNEIAKLMGFPNGNYVNYTQLEVTNSMLDAFISMADHQKTKHGITITNTITDKPQNDGKAPSSSDGESGGFFLQTMEKVMLAGYIDKEENKFGIVVNHMVNAMDEESDTTGTSKAKIFYPVTGSSLTSEELKDKIEKIMFELYIEKVDCRKNYIIVNGSKLEVEERKKIKENIRNIDIEKIKRSMRKTLDEGSRRGLIFVGEPGVGKTISVHKLINNFQNNLVFWVKPDSISSVSGIRSTFKIFKMFKNSIMIFDDIDSAPLTSKNEVTNEFLAELDGTSKLTGFIIATVNDPSKLHPALINRPERFDEAIEVKTPQTYEEILEILESKAKDAGYYYENERTYGKVNGHIKVNLSTKETQDTSTPRKGKKSTKANDVDSKLTSLMDLIIKNKLTQVQVAGLIRHCHQYYGEITTESLTDAYNTQINSIKCSHMIAKKGRLIEDDGLSDEAYAALQSGSRSR